MATRGHWRGRPGGRRGGSASPGAFGRETAALGRVAVGREVPGRSPSRGRPRTPGGPAPAPLYLRRVARASGSSSSRHSFTVCLSPSALDPRSFFSPLRGSCIGKVAGPGGQARVTCGPAHGLPLSRGGAERSLFLPGPWSSPGHTPQRRGVSCEKP